MDGIFDPNRRLLNVGAPNRCDIDGAYKNTVGSIPFSNQDFTYQLC